MTGGNAPLGRRDNGLHTTDYAVLADVDPRIGEHLLDLLGDRGIAAYLKPTSDVDPFTRTASLPSPPTDRLYVDRSSIPTARRMLAEAMSGETIAGDAPSAQRAAGEAGQPGDDSATAGDPSDASTDALTTVEPDGSGFSGPPTTGVTGSSPATGADDFEAAWAQIVAGYSATAAPLRNWPGDGTFAGAPATDPTAAPTQNPGQSPPQNPAADPTRGTGHGPGGGKRDPRGSRSADPAADGAPADGSEPPKPRRVVKPTRPYLNDDRGSLLDGLDSFGAGLPDDDDEEDFKPPPPPPLPRVTPTAIGGVVAIVLGLLAIFYPDAVASVLATTETQVLGGALVLGGTALLVSRLRPGTGDDEDSDPDDGAVV